VTFIKLRNRTY